MANNNLTNNLTISRENAIAAYDNTDANGRKLLEHLFGKELFVKKDITERVKTFEDACNELGQDHPFVKLYNLYVVTVTKGAIRDTDKDVFIYLKLRIITAALNEGWEPQFTEDEYRYYPFFGFYTQRDLNKMSDDKKGRVLARAAHHNLSAGGCLAFEYVSRETSFSWNSFGSRLAFKNSALADYAGRQFVEFYADFICGLHFSRKGVKNSK